MNDISLTAEDLETLVLPELVRTKGKPKLVRTKGKSYKVSVSSGCSDNGEPVIDLCE